MGVNKKLTPAALTAAHSAASGTKRDIHFQYSNQVPTSREGPLLGVVLPVWLKVVESEQRLSWLQKMVKRDLCVREIESYAKSQHSKLRSDELKLKESERSVLLGLMDIKVKDEKRNLVRVMSIREELRR